MPERRDVEFPSAGETCAAWHLVGEGDELAGEGGRPCVVMAHGIGGTKDSGLLPFAEAFADAGLDVVLFDYRGFGESGGELRQLAWPPRHHQDYAAATHFARGLDGIDPLRIVLWGTSWSGGHVVHVAAHDHEIAAVISQTPDFDGLRTLLQMAKYAGPMYLLRTTAHGLRDALGTLRRQPPHLIPVVAEPGEIATMSSEEAKPGYEAIAGPTWRNQVAARSVLYEALDRSITKMDQLACPILIQIAERDSVAPPEAARAAAWRAKGRVEVREYPCAHFDVYLGQWRERAIADQLHFLQRHLAADRSATSPQARPLS